jgi:rhamnosyltransferase subunit B
MSVSAHFVIVLLGSAGDVFPFMPVAKAARARGFTVTVLASRLFEDVAVGAGLGFHALFEEEESMRMLAHPDLWHPRRGVNAVWSMTLPILERVPAFIAGLPADAPCVVLTHPMGLPAAAIAKAARPDLRLVTAFLAPSNLSSCHDPMMVGELFVPPWVPMALRRWLLGLVERKMIDPGTLPDLNRARAAAGLAPVTNFWQYVQHTGDAAIGLFPAWFAPRQPEWPRPFHHAGFQLYDPAPDAPFSPELTAFLAQGEAPIVFAPGTAYLQGEHYFRSALAATRKLGRRAIFLTRFPEQLPPDLPPNVLWQAFVPLHRLLPHAALLVYHGGVGTMAEALRAGVPQLVVPCAFDQFDHARRIAALGVGAVLSRRFLWAGSLARAMSRVLAAPTVRARCSELSSRFDAGSNVEAMLDTCLDGIAANCHETATID